MDKTDCPSDSTESSSSSWEFIEECKCDDENLERDKKFESSEGAKNGSNESDTDGISVISENEECQQIDSGTDESDLDGGLFSNIYKKELTSKDDTLGAKEDQVEANAEGHGMDSLTNAEQQQINLEVETLSPHIVQPQANNIASCIFVSNPYLTVLSIGFIALSILLAPLGNIIAEHCFNSASYIDNDADVDIDGNSSPAEDECGFISERCLMKYLDKNKEALGYLSEGSKKFKMQTADDDIAYKQILKSSKAYAKNSNVDKKVKKSRRNDKKKVNKDRKINIFDYVASEDDENVEEKGSLKFATKRLEDFSEKEFVIFIRKLKKKKEKLKVRAEFLKEKEKYLCQWEHELSKKEQELAKQLRELNKVDIKEKKHSHSEEYKSNNIKKEKLKSKYAFKSDENKSSKEKNYYIKDEEKNDTVSGEWYDNMYSAREKIRKEEHASDWLFDLYNFREKKRKEQGSSKGLLFERVNTRNKKRNKSSWVNVNQHSHFKR